MQEENELLDNTKTNNHAKAGEEMNTTISRAIQKLNQEMTNKGMSVAELARTAKISQPTTHRILSGQSDDPKLSNLQQLAYALDINLLELFSDTHAVGEARGTYTVKNEPPVFTIRDLDNDRPATKSAKCPVPHGPNTFGLLIEGDPTAANPMHPSYGRAYPVGSIVFADPDQAEHCVNGDIVIAELTDRTNKVTAFRQLYQEGGSELLIPLNPQFPPVLEPFKITAKVIGAILP